MFIISIYAGNTTFSRYIEEGKFIVILRQKECAIKNQNLMNCDTLKYILSCFYPSMDMTNSYSHSMKVAQAAKTQQQHKFIYLLHKLILSLCPQI